jgi:hypothetical protein
MTSTCTNTHTGNVKGKTAVNIWRKHLLDALRQLQHRGHKLQQRGLCDQTAAVAAAAERAPARPKLLLSTNRQVECSYTHHSI